MKKINNKILFVSLIVILSVSLDQVTKMVAYIQKDKIGDGIKILDFFNIVYVENRGISFGIFSSLDASFYLGILSFLDDCYGLSYERAVARFDFEGAKTDSIPFFICVNCTFLKLLTNKI